jgi:phasin family protein
MATKASAGAASPAAKSARKRRAPRQAPRTQGRSAEPPPSRAAAMELPRMPKVLTPEQAMEMYKVNARMALDVINAAIEGTQKLRRKQFEGEEQAREFQKKHVRAAGQATDPQSLMALGQGAAQEALEKSMHYWGEMFELIVEIQKRLFALIEEQTKDVPGVKEAKAAMAMMPDLGQMQKVVSAMQGVLTSGGTAFESMQRVMGDFARLAQGSMGRR